MPTDFPLRQWKQARFVAWSVLLGDQIEALPNIEEVQWMSSGVNDQAAKVLRVRRDFLSFDLGFHSNNQLNWVEVHADVERGIAKQRLELEAGKTLTQQWARPLAGANQTEVLPDSLLKVAPAANQNAKERYQDLLNQFEQASALHFDATAVLKLAQQEQATEVGNIQLQMRFLRPGLGSLQMKGWVGLQKRAVHSQIIGTENGLVHVDHIKKTATLGGSYDAIANGMSGFAPLSMWLGIDVERAIDVKQIEVPGNAYGWTGLQVESHELITVYRFDPRQRLVGAAVIPKDSGSGLQIMEYRFHGLELPNSPKSKLYQFPVPYPATQSDSSKEEQSLLKIGAELPPDHADYAGCVLFFYLDAGPKQEQDLEQIRRLWRPLERDHPGIRLVQIPATDSAIGQAFGVRYFPTFYVVGRDGRISERFVGWNSQRLTRAVRRL